MDPDLARRIRDDNRRMHDAPGYADFYDDQLALIRNPWEQRAFHADLARIARRLPRGFRALDLGCGTGNFTLKLVRLGAEVTGVDLSAGMLDRLRRKLGRAGLDAGGGPDLIQSDVDDFLRSCRQRFDLVCACSFLHHLPDYLQTVAAAAALVADDGCMYVAHEPLAAAECDGLGRAIEWVDFRWQRLEARTGVGGRVARRDPYYQPDCLADYWAMGRGLDPARLHATLRAAGLAPRLTTYDSKRHRLMHVLACWLDTRHLLKFEAWRGPAFERQHRRPRRDST